jgi:PilZ domain-containing protein
MTNNDYQEKRGFVRMGIETQVTYTIKNNGSISHHGYSQNLSATGLYMTTDYEPNLGDLVEIVMNPSGDRLLPFVAEGNVIRCEQDTNNKNMFHVSVKLEQVS